MKQSLESVCLNIVDCEHKTSPIDESGGFFAVGTPAMRGNVIDFSQARRISEETFKAWTRRMRPKFGDLLFAREAPVGPVVLIPREENVAAGQRTVLLRPDPKQLNTRFLYYLLSSPMQQKKIEALAAGSTVAHLNVSDVRSLEIQVPPIAEQRALAEVLGALDDKIAVNVKLANIADEWIRGEYDLLTTLSSEHRALSEIVINRRNTANPEMLEAKVPYVGLEHIPRRLMWLGEHGSSDEVSSNKSHFKAGDILFGKLRPYFHKIVTAPNAGICSTDVLVLTPMDEALSGFALASLAHDCVVQAVTSASEGTRMPRTSWKDLSSINVPWPGHEAAESFSTRVSAIRDYVIGLMAENQTLAATRDALLPQLMSGKLRVKEAEALGESAV
ncbi:restriction endonuclease subunit S [Glutamicibacter sp. NPDC055491]